MLYSSIKEKKIIISIYIYMQFDLSTSYTIIFRLLSIFLFFMLFFIFLSLYKTDSIDFRFLIPRE